MKELEVTVEQAFKQGLIQGKIELCQFVLDELNQDRKIEFLKLFLEVNIKMLEQEKKYV